MRKLLALVCCSVFATSALAAPHAEKISWKDGDKDFDGYLVWDDASTTRRPGLVMVPNWYGVSDAAVEKAKVLAGKDYVILLADVYGRGVRPKTADEAGKAAGEASADPNALRSHAAAALATLEGAGKQAPLDRSRIGAIGFCFGGMVALELGRMGAEVDGIATFHANLSTKSKAGKGALRGPVLVMNGADDSFVPQEQIQGFQDEMREAGADWQFVNFGNAQHCFAEPDEDGSLKGCQYHAVSYERSVSMMGTFFREAFTK